MQKLKKQIKSIYRNNISPSTIDIYTSILEKLGYVTADFCPSLADNIMCSLIDSVEAPYENVEGTEHTLSNGSFYGVSVVDTRYGLDFKSWGLKSVYGNQIMCSVRVNNIFTKKEFDKIATIRYYSENGSLIVVDKPCKGKNSNFEYCIVKIHDCEVLEQKSCSKKLDWCNQSVDVSHLSDEIGNMITTDDLEEGEDLMTVVLNPELLTTVIDRKKRKESLANPAKVKSSIPAVPNAQ